MITYFVEQDLVSFGTFLLSKDREQAYINQGIDGEKLVEILKNVNTFDLTTWFNLVVQAANKNLEQPSAEDKQLVETTEMPLEEESKTNFVNED